MKKKVTHPDGRVEEFEGTPKEFRELDEVPWRLTPTTTEPAVAPWVQPLPWEVKRQGIEQPCSIAQYFKDHPHEKAVSMVCFCPRCTVQCSFWGGLSTNNPGMETIRNVGTITGQSTYVGSTATLDLSNLPIPAVACIS